MCVAVWRRMVAFTRVERAVVVVLVRVAGFYCTLHTDVDGFCFLILCADFARLILA